MGRSWQAQGAAWTVNQVPVGLSGWRQRTGLVARLSDESLLPLGRRTGKICSEWQADADAPPSPGAAGFLASPALHSRLRVPGSEVLQGAGAAPRMLSATQISCLKKESQQPACLPPPLPAPPYPALLPSSPLPSFLQLFLFFPSSFHTSHHGALTLTRSKASLEENHGKHSPWF